MKRLLLLSLLLLFFPLGASAQKDSFWKDLHDFLDMRADKAYARLDSNYLARYPYHWDARLFVKSSGLHITSVGLGEVDLSTGMSNRAGVGVSYRGVELSYSVALGKTLGFDLGLSSYGSKFGFEYTLRGSSALAGQVTLPGEGTRTAENGDLTLLASNLNAFYCFNPRFSYSAAMKQAKIQRRSAGSFIAAASWTVWDVMEAGPEIISRKTSLQTFLDVTNLFYNRFSIGAGYGYNLVLGQAHWLLHASVIPMWTFYDATTRRVDGISTRITHPMGKFAFTGTARAGIYYRWGTRWSVGMSGVVNQMASSSSLRPGTQGYQRFGAQDWQMRLSFIVRF